MQKNHERTEAPAPLLVSLDDAAARLGIGMTSLYGLMNSGALKPVKIGRRVLISARELEEFVSRLVAAA